MSIPFRRDRAPGPAADPTAARGTGGRLRPSEVIHRLGILEQTPAFYALPDYALRRLARRLRPLDLGAGHTLVARGTTGDSLYLIERGSFHVTVDTERGGPARVTTVGKGETCGGSALLGEPSPVSVVAATEGRVLALDLTSLRAVVRTGEAADAELRQQLSRREAGYRALAARVQRDADAPAGDGTIVAMYSPRGGTGRTTLSLNLAAQLAQGHAGEVLVIDLDLPYTPAALLAGLVPTDSLVRASWAASLGTDAELRDALTSAAPAHETGFLLLSAALRLAESELITTEQVSTAIQAVRGAFRHVIVDLGSSLSEITLTVCDQARHLVLVVTPELASLKGAREALDLFREMHVPDDRISVVLNHRQAESAVPPESVARTLGVAPAIEVRHDGGRPGRAALTGSMLASDPKSEVGRAVRRLAELVSTPRARGEGA